MKSKIFSGTIRSIDKLQASVNNWLRMNEEKIIDIVIINQNINDRGDIVQTIYYVEGK